MNQHLMHATLKLPCERTQSTVERAAHCKVRISLLLGSQTFRYFLSHPPFTLLTYVGHTSPPLEKHASVS